MGCCLAKNLSQDLDERTFRVYPVNRYGVTRMIPGTVEVTYTVLVLRPHDRETILWPFHCVRNFGFEGNVFSFEIGCEECRLRSDIYVFKCDRPEELFNLLIEATEIAPWFKVPRPAGCLACNLAGKFKFCGIRKSGGAKIRVFPYDGRLNQNDGTMHQDDSSANNRRNARQNQAGPRNEPIYEDFLPMAAPAPPPVAAAPLPMPPTPPKPAVGYANLDLPWPTENSVDP